MQSDGSTAELKRGNSTNKIDVHFVETKNRYNSLSHRHINCFVECQDIEMNATIGKSDCSYEEKWNASNIEQNSRRKQRRKEPTTEGKTPCIHFLDKSKEKSIRNSLLALFFWFKFSFSFILANHFCSFARHLSHLFCHPIFFSLHPFFFDRSECFTFDHFTCYNFSLSMRKCEGASERVRERKTNQI